MPKWLQTLNNLSDAELLNCWNAMKQIEDWQEIVNGITMLELCEVVYSELNIRNLHYSILTQEGKRTNNSLVNSLIIHLITTSNTN